ncbi:MAG: GNAT family N-acetyltransferase [Acidimicrobiia bacterium]
MIRRRRTVPEDVDFLWRMLYFASHSNDEPGIRPGDIRSDPELVGYIEGWKTAGHFGVIAEVDGMPVGAAWLRAPAGGGDSNPVFVDEDTPELAVAVEPGFEGRGIGSTMIRDLFADVIGEFPAVVLSARAENPAVRLYERLGFATVSTIGNRVGTVSVKMVKTL